MIPTVTIFRQLLESIKLEFPTAVVTLENEGKSCEAVRSNQLSDSLIDPMTGRIDPDTFVFRALASECGPISNGKTITIAGDPVNVMQVEPDSIGVVVKITVKKRRMAAA